MVIERFAPPGNTEDLSGDGRAVWSAHVEALLKDGIAGDPGTPGDSPRPQFFNPLGVEFGDDTAVRDLSWGAFPRKLARLPAPERWRLAEAREAQEEYCEWAAQTDAEGNLVRVHFTTEFSDYFQLLAHDDADALARMHSDVAGEPVADTDLVRPDGGYRSNNPWNLRAAMHMVQRNNTLAAAVLLVAQSTILREGSEGVVTDANDLIRCGIVADPDRNSDPLLVTEVNALARAGALVTFADPVGIYITQFRADGIEAPDGADASEFWGVIRGTEGMALHAVFEVPSEVGYSIADLKIGGVPLISPSQLAERVDVSITAVAHQSGEHTAELRPCGPTGSHESIDSALPSVSELVQRSTSTR